MGRRKRSIRGRYWSLDAATTTAAAVAAAYSCCCRSLDTLLLLLLLPLLLLLAAAVAGQGSIFYCVCHLALRAWHALYALQPRQLGTSIQTSDR